MNLWMTLTRFIWVMSPLYLRGRIISALLSTRGVPPLYHWASRRRGGYTVRSVHTFLNHTSRCQSKQALNSRTPPFTYALSFPIKTLRSKNSTSTLECGRLYWTFLSVFVLIWENKANGIFLYVTLIRPYILFLQMWAIN